jgi:hypothetical protein
MSNASATGAAVDETLMPQQPTRKSRQAASARPAAVEQSQGTASAPLNLRQKLAAVRRRVHNVEKRGRNQFHSYDCAMAADVAGLIGTALAEANVIVARRNLQVTRGVTETRETIVELNCEYGFIDGDSDEEIWQPAYGEGRDRSDKAAYKAFTGALKYYLVQAFLLATGDDPENDSGSVGAGAIEIRTHEGSQEVRLVSEAQQKLLRARAHEILDWDDARLREFASVDIGEIRADALDALLQRIAELGEAPIDQVARDALVSAITVSEIDPARILKWVAKPDFERLTVRDGHRIMQALRSRKPQPKTDAGSAA